MNKIQKNAVTKDIYRYYGKNNLPLKMRIALFLGLIPEIKYMIYFRKQQFSKTKLQKYYYKYKIFSIRKKTHIQIPPETEIGEGFYIGHSGRIIINGKAKLGKNINIATGVTIGQTNRGKKKGYPTIGNDVWIGTNAVIVGNIIIGDDVLIAPNSYVNVDIPSHSIVLGNPATIHHRENATIGYINNKV